MSATSPCVPCCSTPQSVNVPGVPGANGGAGTNGVNAFALTTANFNVPAVGATVTVSVNSSLWMVVGQIVIANGPANFLVTALPTSASATLMFLGYPGDVAPGTAILSGATIGPAGQRGDSTVYFTSTAADLAATAFMDVIEVTATGKTVTLPTAVGIAGKMYLIKLMVVGSATVAASGGQTFDGAATLTVASQYSWVAVISNGANWEVIGVGHPVQVRTSGIGVALNMQDEVMILTAGGLTATLPTASGNKGKLFTVKQVTGGGAGTVATVAGNIDGIATYTLAGANNFVTVVSDGTNYWIIAFG